MNIATLYRQYGIDAETLAYHESGHAIIAVDLGVNVEWVSIDRQTVAQRGYRGRESFTKTRFRPDPTTCSLQELNPALIKQLHQAAVWIAGGEAAQRRGTGRVLPPGIGDADDAPRFRLVYERLVAVGELEGGDTFAAWKARAWMQAVEHLSRRWEAVERLVAELKRIQTVDGTFLHQLGCGSA
jgi:hypothetical protein